MLTLGQQVYGTGYMGVVQVQQEFGWDRIITGHVVQELPGHWHTWYVCRVEMCPVELSRLSVPSKPSYSPVPSMY